MSKRVQGVLLCEDSQQEVFVRHYLKSRGLEIRFAVKRNPGVKGSGEQYVREHYPQEVRAYRSKASYLTSLVLIVVADADTLTVEGRMRQLARALAQSSQPPRQDGERIALFIPKRNIETWMYYLQRQAVNERDDYKPLVNRNDCKNNVARLAREICPQGLPDDAPPSLHIACIELARIFP